MMSSSRTRSLAAAALLALAGAAPLVSPALAAPAAPAPESSVIHYRTAKIEGVDVFYREAGPKGAPVVLLLHGFPSSSHEFRMLIPALADRYHVIAPDYPGFGQSGAPDHSQFKYTFAHIADVVDGLLGQLGVERFAMYIQDYGAPVGLRLALKHPEAVTGIITQNGNAYAEGIQGFWDPVKALWAADTEANRRALDKFVLPETTRWQYLNGVKDPTRVSPDAWSADQSVLDRPGERDIQMDLFYDYRTNIDLYPEFQAFLRKRQPPTLVVWGANDVIFPPDGARAFKRDLPRAELHLLDTGHFALEDKADVMIPLIRDFLARTQRGR